MKVYVVGGTDAKVNVDQVSICDVNSSLSVVSYNLTYPNEGSFEVIVSAYNLASNVTKSRIIGVYERIVDLVISGNSTILTPPGSGTWRVAAGTDQHPLEDIVCVWNMGTNYGDTTHNVAVLNSLTPHEITFTYGQADAGTQTVSVNCSNTLSSQKLTMNVTVVNPVTYVNFSAASLAFTRDYVGMRVYVVGGSDAKVNVDQVPICDVSSSLSVVSYNLTYPNEGSFEVIVSAYNLASNVTKSRTIGVYERIVDLVISGNSTILTPPGSGTWRVAAGTDQLPLENIVCVWNMGTNYVGTAHNVAVLNSSTPHQITFTYGQADAGTQTVNVSCSNALSSQNLSMDVTVVWDNVTLGELTCNSSTLWNHSITCKLTVVHFGTGACFEWDMGDGKPLVYYQDGYCADYVPAASPTYIQVGFSQNV